MVLGGLGGGGGGPERGREGGARSGLSDGGDSYCSESRILKAGSFSGIPHFIHEIHICYLLVCFATSTLLQGRTFRFNR